MIIKNLHIYNFKNHAEKNFEFSPSINCFVGNNGVGKTNVLDALYYLSVGKSFLGNSDVLNIKQGDDFFVIDARIQNEEKEDIVKIQQARELKKVIKKNDKTYDRLADHVGYLPNVTISPYDSNLISDSGESRRKFLDAMISQTNPDYLFQLIQYQKTIQQRNALLKYFAKNRCFDQDSLDIYNQPIINFGISIFEVRKAFIRALNPVVQQFYETISGNREEVSVNYQSHLLEGDFEMLLKENVDKDRALTYTSKGIHKDDLYFEMNGNFIKKMGSQGQQKSFLIALKLAQIKRIKSITGKNPILLLDDIFDKLDDTRVSQLISLINTEKFGQMFITDTHKTRTESIVSRITDDSRIFEI